MDGPFARFAASLHVQPPAQTTNGGWVGRGEGDWGGGSGVSSPAVNGDNFV